MEARDDLDLAAPRLPKRATRLMMSNTPPFLHTDLTLWR